MQAKEGPDAVREKLPEQQREIQTVLRQPWEELPIWQRHAKDTEAEIDRLRLHAANISNLRRNPRRSTLIRGMHVRAERTRYTRFGILMIFF